MVLIIVTCPHQEIGGVSINVVATSDCPLGLPPSPCMQFALLLSVIMCLSGAAKGFVSAGRLLRRFGIIGLFRNVSKGF